MARIGLAIALQQQQKFDQANAALREAIRLKPESADAHIGLGDSFAMIGKLDEAISEFREAIRFAPENADRPLPAWICA